MSWRIVTATLQQCRSGTGKERLDYGELGTFDLRGKYALTSIWSSSIIAMVD
jgi:hypothetical protein